MTDYSDFLIHAWRNVARALVRAGVAAGLELRPAVLAKSAKRRCMAQLKQLTRLIRRLIFLMALGMEVAPPDVREGRNWFRDEDTKPAPGRRSLRIAPAPSGPLMASLWSASGPSRPEAGPVAAAPVLARWHLLIDALRHRERRAKCLARTLLRWQAAGDAKPYVPPMARMHRMPCELGLIAAALPMLLARAMQDWPDTG